MNARVLLVALLATNIVSGAQSPPSPATGSTPMLLAPLPAGWSSMAGNGGPEALPGTCEIGVDSQNSVAGRQVYSVRCANSVLPSYGGARNTIQTARFRGKRVRVSAWLRASGIAGVSTAQYSGVAGEAGLWIGVGSPKQGTRMDRMQSRAIKGTTDWVFRDFVVDVPADNNQMFVGYWMQGQGQLWARDFNIEEVPDTVPVNFLVNDPERVVGPDLSLLTATAARPTDLFLPPPAKWLAQGGPGFELCDVGVDAQMLKNGQPNLSIACGVFQTPVLRQAFEAAPFRGKRVRFSGWIRIENFESPATGAVQGAVGLFLGTDTQSPAVRADAKGTSGWQLHELVMDVPPNATWILIGLALSGKGQVWGRDFKFEEVSSNMPVTPAPTAVR
jgi:hypothetical protein